MQKKSVSNLIFILVISLVFSTSAYSYNVLYVDDDDGNANSNIAVALTADGHNVTSVFNDYVDDVDQVNTLLQGDLSAYSIIIWAASGDSGSGDPHALATTSNLASWVTNGGWLFVTGYDTLISPEDPNLVTLVGGGTFAHDGGSLGLITLANELTTGVVNLVGVTPAELGDQDDVPRADLGADTVCVSGGETACSWMLRTLGNGYVAYVSTDGDNADWLATSPGADGYAYNGALRNFVFNFDQFVPSSMNNIPTLTIWGSVILIALFGFIGLNYRRRFR